jgi:pyruvate,water dikinase
MADDISLIDDLKRELGGVINPEKAYAIRSSANIEDSFENSFAGQFKTSLNISGIDGIIQAIWSVWSSTQAPNVVTYLETHGIDLESLRMAILIQDMVDPVYSGVVLTKNPVNGYDEVIVEAVPGHGDKLVQGGVTPFRWVNKWGYFLEQQMEEILPIELVDSIIGEAKEISDKFGFPVDLEWVYDGEEVYWVQVREVPALHHETIYSNHLSREMIPGIIKPLIFSINIPLVNAVWINWISEITGNLGIKPEDLAKSFYYRVYFNMGVLGRIFSGLGFPAESVEMLMGTLPSGAARPSFKPTLKTFSRLPWLLAFFWDKWRFGPKMKRALKRLEPEILKTEFENLTALTKHDLITAIDKHFMLMQETAYYNVLGPLLMGMYNNTLKSLLSKEGVEFNNFALTEGMTELLEFDPSTKLAELHEHYSLLPDELLDRLHMIEYDELKSIPEAQNFISAFEAFLKEFGHLSDSGNDFSFAPWRETPTLVLDIISAFEPVEEPEDSKIKYSDLNLGWIRKLLLDLFYQRAREFRLLREEVSALYTYGYGLFRYYYLALGRIFVQEGMLENVEDIFFLSHEEIRILVDGEEWPQSAIQIVAQHKHNIEEFADSVLPKIIVGDEQPLVDYDPARVLVGIGSSGGIYRGCVCKVSGLQDMRKVNPGDVLVVPYSDVSWTPLFQKAGAVIAESGGLLSHSSIIARELNIPGVVNVNGASLLEDGLMVTVDGNQGKVYLHD